MPKHHGHVFCPSWEYRGFGADIVNCCARSKVKSTPSSGELTTMIKSFWCRILPADLWPIGECKLSTTNASYNGDYLFNGRYARAINDYFSNLVCSGIDKCNGRLIFMCLKRFQQLYEQTFPVTRDLVHYERLTRNRDEELLRLRTFH